MTQYYATNETNPLPFRPVHVLNRLPMHPFGDTLVLVHRPVGFSHEVSFSMTDFPFSRCAVLGTGLIGGSLAWALTQRVDACTVVGFDRPRVLDQATERGIIHAKAASMGRAVKEADLVVLAFPPAKIVAALEQIAPHLMDGAIVTDVASVKQAVVDQANDVLPEHVTFVGGHPMAGAETAGIEGADPILFENAAYVLTPTDATPPQAVNRLRALIDTVGGTALELSPEAHDRVVAQISHLPQLLAVALMQHAAESDEDALALAAGGFRDLTRIASSPFGLWKEILVGNQGAILDTLADFTRRLQTVQRQVAMGDMEALETAFTDARTARERLPEAASGLMRNVYDCTVRVPDMAGALHEMTKPLAAHDISVADIELLRVREGRGGTFRLAFASKQALATALNVLNEAGFDAWAQ